MGPAVLTGQPGLTASTGEPTMSDVPTEQPEDDEPEADDDQGDQTDEPTEDDPEAS